MSHACQCLSVLTHLLLPIQAPGCRFYFLPTLSPRPHPTCSISPPGCGVAFLQLVSFSLSLLALFLLPVQAAKAPCFPFSLSVPNSFLPLQAITSLLLLPLGCGFGT